MVPILHSSVYQNLRTRRDIAVWQYRGRPVPAPPGVKQYLVTEISRSFPVSTFIETGTYLGEMVFAMRGCFDRIVSIELSPDLHVRARRRFARYQHIELYCGDSGKLLPKILEAISTPCLFWLDGHYSEGCTAKGEAETPILKELDAIFAHSIRNHIVVIDDARCFDGTHDYPTMSQLRSKLEMARPEYELMVMHDILVFVPRAIGVRPLEAAMLRTTDG